MKRFSKALLAAACSMSMLPAALPVSLQPVLAAPSAEQEGTVISVTDFGADPSGIKDSTKAVQKAIAAAKALGQPATISFAQGTYQFYPETAEKRELYLSNTVGTDANNKIKEIGILLENMKDITIDGQGSTFMMHGRMTPYAAIECENVEFRNFHVDCAVPTCMDATVESVSGNTAVVYIPEVYNYEISGTSLQWSSDISPYTGRPYWTASGAMSYQQRYNLETGYAVRGSAEYLNGVSSIERLENNRVRITYSSKPAGVQPGMVYEVHFGVRDEVAGYLWKNKDVRLTDLEVNYVHGFGILFQHNENITLNGLRFDVLPGSGRSSSVAADDLHFSGTKGKIDIQNCLFRNPHDDPINVHGTFNQVVEKISSNKLRVRFMHHQAQGFPNYFVGDQIEFCTKQDLITVPDSIRTVTAVDGPDGRGGIMGEGSGSLSDIILTLDGPIPDEVTANNYAVENITYTPEVYIANNRFIESPVRGILCTTRGKTVIENNLFDNMNMAAIYISNDAQFWYESGPIRDLTIRKNTFVRCGSQAIFIEPTNPTVSTNNTVHRNIKVEDNLFFANGRRVLDAKSVDGLTFKNNTVLRENPLSEPVIEGPSVMEAGCSARISISAPAATVNGRLFNFNGCKNVQVEGNHYDGGLNAGSSLSNMAASDVRIVNDASKAGADSLQASAASIHYYSDHPEICSVSQDGLLQAHKAGTASIHGAIVLDGRLFETPAVSITVEGENENLSPESIAMANPSQSVTAGDSLQMQAELSGPEGMDESITWTISDALTGQNCSFASIDENGLVTTTDAGIALVTAAAAGGLQASAVISIQKQAWTLSDQASMAVETAPDKWSADTESISLQLCYQGLYENQQPGNTVAFDLPEDITNLDLTIKASGTHETGWGATGLYLYKDPDNYVSIERKNRGGAIRRMALVREQNQSAQELWLGGGVNAGPSVTNEDIWFRLTKTGNTITAFYSTDGTEWTQVSSCQADYLNEGVKAAFTALDPNADDNSTRVRFTDLTINGVKQDLTKLAVAPAAAPVLAYSEENDLASLQTGLSGGEAAVFWAVSDSEDGQYRLLDGKGQTELTVAPGLQNQYLKALVVPYEKTAIGDGIWSNAVLLSGEGRDVVSEMPSSSAFLKTLKISGIENAMHRIADDPFQFVTASVDEQSIDYLFESVSDQALITLRHDNNVIESAKGSISGSAVLHNGANLFEIHVDAQDGKTIRDYRAVVFKAESSDDSLSVLKVNGQDATEGDVIRLEGSTASIEAAASLAKAKTEIFCSGNPVTDGVLTLQPGVNEVIVKITTPTAKTPRLVRLQIVTPDAANAALEQAVFNDGQISLSQTFDSGRTDYSLRCASSVLAFDFKAMESSASIEVLCNEQSIARGKGALQYSARLLSGNNVLKAIVTSPDGSSSTTYTFNAECAGTVYLSDMDWVSSTCGFGTLHRDASIDGNPLMLFDGEKEIVFEKGIGTHGRSEIVISLEGLQATSFDAMIGVDRETGNKPNEANMTFEVLVDGTSVLKTGEMNYATPMQAVHVDVTNAKTLKLIADGVRNTWSCHADWADARLTIPFTDQAADLTVQNDNEEAGTIEGLPEDLLAGEYVTLHAEANPGWMFESWKDGEGNVLSTDNPWTFRAAEAMDIHAVFVKASQETSALKDLLSMTLAYAKNLGEEDLQNVNSLVLNALHQAMDEAERLLSDENAGEEALKEAWKNLSDTIHMLGFTTDKSALQARAAELSALDLNRYTEESAAALRSALENASAVLEDPAALDEVSIKEALARLDEAAAGLQLKDSEQTDKSLLQLLIETGRDANLDLYMQEGKEAFIAALRAGEAVFADESATQSQINEAAAALHESWLALRLKADESLLQALQNRLASLESLDLSSLSSALQADIQAVKDEIKAALSQNEVEKSTADRLIARADALLSKAPQSQAKSAASVRTAAGGMQSALAAMGASLLAMLLLKRRNRK